MELPLRDSINWAPEGMRLRFEPARLAALRSAVPRDCYFCLSGRYLLKQIGPNPRLAQRAGHILMITSDQPRCRPPAQAWVGCSLRSKLHPYPAKSWVADLILMNDGRGQLTLIRLDCLLAIKPSRARASWTVQPRLRRGQLFLEACYPLGRQRALVLRRRRGRRRYRCRWAALRRLVGERNFLEYDVRRIAAVAASRGHKVESIGLARETAV